MAYLVAGIVMIAGYHGLTRTVTQSYAPSCSIPDNLPLNEGCIADFVPATTSAYTNWISWQLPTTPGDYKYLPIDLGVAALGILALHFIKPRKITPRK
jgi:hypothetical protein